MDTQMNLYEILVDFFPFLVKICSQFFTFFPVKKKN